MIGTSRRPNGRGWFFFVEPFVGAIGGQVDVFVFGNSHVMCMKKALVAEGQPDGGTLAIGNLNDFKDRIGQPGYGVPQIIDRLLAQSDMTGAADLWVSRMGGSEHVSIGWVEGDRPFDFILPGHDGMALRPDAELVPYQLVHAVLQRRVSGSLNHLRRILPNSPAPLVHLESPPPISDTEYAQDHLDVFFKQHGATPRVAPAGLRWKLWKLQTNLSRALCADIGIRYVPSPPEVLDENGFLTRKFWSQDATHGNPAYGAMWNRYVVDLAANPREVTA